jgi:hypothetical protein
MVRQAPINGRIGAQSDMTALGRSATFKSERERVDRRRFNSQSQAPSIHASSPGAVSGIAQAAAISRASLSSLIEAKAAKI